jgi:aspartyl-tRNA(Asn)/glutamyl-tRNA(Gln) amidotransferase subunit A
MLGKLHTHEFAYGPTGESSMFGPARNPWDTDRVPGGSSSGSGAAVALGLCAGATGSDTGGSIRMPAACCGIVGLKPTYGRASRYGIFPLCWTMDHPGPMTRTVYDTALMLQPIARPDPKDPATVAREAPDYAAALTDDLRGVRVGLPSAYFYDRAEPEVERAVRAAAAKLGDLGADVREVEIPHMEHAAAAALTIYLAEATAYHDDTQVAQGALYTDQVRTFIELGNYVLAKDYLHAQRYRRLLGRSMVGVLEQVDVLVTPTLPITATPLGQETITVRGIEQTVFAALLRNTEPFDLTGQPALALPCGFSGEGLPISMQVAGRPFDEATVLRVGHAYQQATDWHRRYPTT